MRGDGGEAIGITTRSRTTTGRGSEETTTETRRYYKTDRLCGTDLNDGKIVSFDEAKQKWNFVCDSEPDEVPYLMAYAAVYKYVDVSASTFGGYLLPADPMRGDGGEEIGITSRSRSTRGSEDTMTETRR